MSDDIKGEAKETKRGAGASNLQEFADAVSDFDRGATLEGAVQDPAIMGDVLFTGARLKQWAVVTQKSRGGGRNPVQETVWDLLTQKEVAERHISGGERLPLGLPMVGMRPANHPAGAGPALRVGTTGALNTVLWRLGAKQAYQKKTELFPLLHEQQLAHNANLQKLMENQEVMNHDFIKEEKGRAKKSKILSDLIDEILAQRARDVSKQKVDLGLYAFMSLCLCTGLGAVIGLEAVSSASAAAPSVSQASAITEKGALVGGSIGLAIGFLLVAILIHRGLKKLNAPENPLSRHTVSVEDMQTYLDQKQTAREKDAVKAANEKLAENFLAALSRPAMDTPLTDQKHSPTADVNLLAEVKQLPLVSANLTMAAAVGQPELMGDKPFTGERLRRWKAYVGEESCQAFLSKTPAFQKSMMNYFVSLCEEQAKYKDTIESNLRFLMQDKNITGHPVLNNPDEQVIRENLRYLLNEVLLKHEERVDKQKSVVMYVVLAAMVATGIGVGLAAHDWLMGLAFSAAPLIAVVLIMGIAGYARQKLADRDLATCPIGSKEMTEKLDEMVTAAEDKRTPLLGTGSQGEA